MRKKINSEAGFTLVETLAAAAVMVLLALMLNAGMQIAFHAYDSSVAGSEMELLLSTAMNALTDDLRYAWDVRTDHAADVNYVDFTYFSDSYGNGTRLGLEGGRIVAKSEDMGEYPVQILPTGAYGAGDNGERAYEVTELTVEPTSGDNIFTITLTVQATADTDIRVTRTVTVRCLNEIIL